MVLTGSPHKRGTTAQLADSFAAGLLKQVIQSKELMPHSFRFIGVPAAENVVEVKNCAFFRMIWKRFIPG